MKLIISAARIAVARALKQKGMTQAQIAEALGVRQAAVSKYLDSRYSDGMRAMILVLERSRKTNSLISAAAKGRIDESIDRLASDSHIVGEALKLQ